MISLHSLFFSHLFIYQNLHQKELRVLDSNKNALKHSMLAYTEKMQKLAAAKSDHTFVDKITSRAKTDFPRTHKFIVTDAFLRQVSDESITDGMSQVEKGHDDHAFLSSSLHFGNNAHLENHGRLSIDSSINIESKNNSSVAIADTDDHDFSDSCYSDSESVTSCSGLSTKSENNLSFKKGVESDECIASDSETLTSDYVRRHRKHYRRKWRIGQGNPQLPTVLDNEPVDDERPLSPAKSEITDLSIEPFPLYSLHMRDDSSDLTHSSLSSTKFSPQHRTFVTKDASMDPKVILKPKPIQSPSVASIRQRHPRKKQKQDNKQIFHRFRYSAQMDEAPETLTQIETSGRHGTSMATIKEMSSELETEDSVSLSPLDEMETIAHFQVVSKRCEKALKSALKTECFPKSHKRKQVHFFLPDIFKT